MSVADDILDVEQAADALRCTPDTIRELARTGRLKGVKPGRDWVFPRALFLQTLNDWASGVPVPPASYSPPSLPSLAPRQRQHKWFGPAVRSAERPSLHL